MRLFSKTAVAFVLGAAIAVPAWPQALPEPPESTAVAKQTEIQKKVGIDQRLNAQVPLDLVFTDETGREVRLGDYFGKRPVVLALVYYECPMLCTEVLNGLTSAIGVLNFEVGREFDVVAVSFNPKEGPELAAQKKQNYVKRYGRPQTAAGWHFLTGKEESIRRLTETVGFRYLYLPENGQYAHGAAVEVLTPRGVISRYFYGIEYSPRDLRFGLMEASEERIGSPVDHVLLLCYHYDPKTGTYAAAILRLVRVGGAFVVAGLFTFLFVSLRRERIEARKTAAAAGNRS
jgi:protein SCO1/2